MLSNDEDRPDFFGITTLAERGQVVIPKAVRTALNLATGDKLVVLPSRHGNGILLIREDEIKQIAQRMNEKADHISQKSKRLQEKLQNAEEQSDQNEV